MASSADDHPCAVKAQQHFLFVTGPLHGHINPVRRLAARVLAANPGARVTFSTAVSGHRRMFPSLAFPDEEVVDEENGVLHVPYSDGYDDGFDPSAHDAREYRVRTRDAGRASLAAVVARLAEKRGPAVTGVVYTFLVAWALDVARDAGVPAALYWIQPATVFAVYHRCFIGGHGDALAAASGSVELPGLPAMTADALPSIVPAASPEHPMHGAFQAFRDLFADIDEHRPMVLVNTFEALEPEALRAVPELEVVAVGPAVPDNVVSRHSRDDDATAAEEGYMAWLDSKAARSVVYVSFGSFVPMSARQEAEMRRGLEATGRPYLWARTGATMQDDAEKERVGMVVSWCEQVRVLSHPAVGCFVTHCGWNSALESMGCGVPVVALPQWTDQPTVAWLLAERAGVGVRAKPAVACNGVVESAELRRCVEAVMGDGQRAADMRARAERWRELGRQAVASGGSSERNLRAFAAGR